MLCAVLERGLSPEEIEEAVEQLQQNWELAAVFDFFQVSCSMHTYMSGIRSNFPASFSGSSVRHAIYVAQ